MKLVKFADGKYGVRRRAWWTLWMDYEFLDLANQGFWWSAGSRYFRDCRGTREAALDGLGALAISGDKGRPE